MASGSGHINRSNTTNSSNSTNVNSHWNFNSTGKEEIDKKSHNGSIFPNNLVMQDRHSGKDPDTVYKGKRKALSQNTDGSFSQDNVELEAVGNSEMLELPLENRHISHQSTGPMYPRTKFTTTTSSAQHNTSQGARQKIAYIKEEPKSEEDRNNIVTSHANTKKQPIWERNRNNSQSSNKEVKINSVSQPIKENSHPDANQILSRLMQIQDYIKQVTVMMENLKKSGDQRVVGRIKKLHKVHADLKDSEKQLLELLDKLSRVNKSHVCKFTKLLNHLHAQENEYLQILQQIMFMQPETKSGTENVSDVDSDADGTDSVSVNLDTKSETSEVEMNPQNDSNETESLSRRNELVKKVIESQEKLKALQDQQSVLLALQHKAENRLAEAKAYRNQIMASIDNEDAVPSPVQIQTNASVVLQDDLESLQQRLNALRDLYDNRQRAQSLSRSFDSEPKAVDESDGLDELQQHELQDKLRDLQDKKRYMDDLLQELRTLQQKHNPQLKNNEQSTNGAQNEPGNLSASAKETLETAQELLHSLDSPQKLRKLEDMKSRLHQLQEIVAVYQNAASESVLSQSSNSVNSQPIACQDEQRKNYQARKSNKVKKTRNQKKDNISREYSNEYLARNLKENQASIQDDSVGEGSDENVLTQNWNSDLQLNDKANKLQTTRDKLRKLQELLAVVQETQASGERINIDFANDLLVSIDEGKATSNEVEEQGIAGVRRVKCQEVNSEVDPNDNDNARSMMYEEGMEDQKTELESILEERNKLLMMQEHIMKLQQQFPVNNSADTQARAPKASIVQKKASLPIGNKEKSKSSESSLKSNQAANQAKQISTPNSNRLQCPNRNKTAQTMHVDAANSESDIVVSNQEIWTEMRQRLIMREELKQKRRELEELMRKDKGKSNSRNQDISDNISYSNKSEALGMSYVGTEGTTAATWGGSTQENPDDQEDHNESQEEIDDLEDNEGYSSEEMIPIEDEERHIPNENHEHSFSADSDFRKLDRNRHRSESHPSIEVAMANNIGRISKSKSDPKDGRNLWVKSPPTRGSNQSWNSHNVTQNRHIRPSEEAIPEREAEQTAGSTHEIPHSLWQQQAIQLQQQLEQTNFLCQSIIRDQNNLAGLLHHCSHINPSTGSSPAEAIRPVVPELLQHYSQQLQQQQLLINLNQCYHLLYLQQTEIHQLQHQLQQVLHLNSSGHSLASEEVPRRNPTNAGLTSEDFEFHPMSANQWFSQLSASPFPRFSPVPPSSRNVDTSNAFAAASATVPLQTNNPSFPTCLNGQQELNRGTETLNNQVPPGTRANNYWDNFRSYSRQNLLSAASANKSNDAGANSSFNSHQLHSVPLLQNRHMLHPERTAHSMDSLHQGVGHNSSTANIQTHPQNEHSRTGFRQVDASTQVVPKLDLQDLLTKARRTKDKNNDHPQPGCTTSETRSSSNYHPSHEGQNASMMPLLGNIQEIDYEGQMNRLFPSLPNAVGFYPFLHPRQVYRESDAPNDHSLFESMRESIYTEVAALISQNEGRPQFLIQLFRELQLLISDYLRQNALIAIQELICQQMSNNSSPHVTRKLEKQQAGSEWLEAPVNTASEHTASESFITSDEEEVRAQLFKMAKVPRGIDASSSKRTCERQRFDYTEQGETGENVATPPASSEHPFASDSMAETVVNVNKIKETNQQKLPFSTCFGQHSPSHSGAKRCSVSEGASSSAQDQGSETSTSDIPYSGLNTNQLDDQIQAIMLEVIPFLKAHLDDVCSPKLLAYIQQLTLSLVTQRDEAMELTQFFQKQLSHILQDTLAKYVGKRLRECGEDLLVDMSEVLFNELAFLRLVQNMDNGAIRSKARNFHSIMQNQDTNWNMSSSEGTPPTEGPKNKPDISKKGVIPQSISSGASGDVEATDADMALIISRLEEDDLGQARDDAMAANCDILEREDINRVISVSQTKVFGNQLERKTDSRSEDLPVIELPGCEGGDQANRGTVSEENDESVYGEADGETEGEGLEDNQDLAEADQSQSHPALERIAVLQNQPSAVVSSNFENGIPADDKINRTEATEDDQIQGTESLGAIGGIVLNGESSGAEGTELEQGLDEVPTKLRPLFQDEVSHPCLEEAVLKTVMQEILEESVEAELVETSSSLLASGEIKNK